MEKLNHLFFKGNYKKITKSYTKGEVKIFNPYVVGAFSFTGQIHEAELYFSKYKKNLKPSELVKSYFFLIIGWTRHSQYEKAQDYLKLSYQLRHKLTDAEDRFFLFQSFGFYRHLGCRFNKSLFWSNLSLKHSFQSEFLWGQILAYDLLGHSQVQTSFIQQGLKNLSLAQDLAILLKLHPIAKTLEVSILCYRAQFGLDPQNITSRLEKALRMNALQDSYSKSNIVLELARQYTLRGQLKKTLSLLGRSQELIMSVGHRRQKALYFLREAEIYFSKNKKTMATQLLSDAEKQLDQKIDLAILAQVRELQARSSSELQQLRLQIGVEENNPEDHLSCLINESKKHLSIHTIHQILDNGYYNLLRQFHSQAYARTILIDLLPDSLTLIDDDTVIHMNECLTPTLKKALNILTGGEITKAQFIELIWQYKYDPLRHDATVYALINRLKKAFREKKDWIETSNGSYYLKPATQVRTLQVDLPKPVSNNPDTQSITDLNLRQIKILHHLKTEESISVKSCQKLFSTTAITANRDLTYLLNQNYLQRVGRGRATAYTLRTT